MDHQRRRQRMSARPRCAFDEGRAPDDDDELAAFAEAVGTAGLDSAKAALKANTDRAIARGVFGVPSLVCETASGPLVFWGVDAFDMLLAWLGDDTLFEREPYRHLADVTVGIERK